MRDIATGDRRVGRFGWKAQHATLLAFGADAYRNEMGITNDLFREELGVGLTAEQYRRCDPLPDPEDRIDPATRRRGIDNFASFMKFLAPAGRGDSRPARARKGEQVFARVGCASCHTPRTDDGAEPRAARSIDSRCRCFPICCCTTSAPATTSRRRPRSPRRSARRRCGDCASGGRLLHDGSAATIEEAIVRATRGEAETRAAALRCAVDQPQRAGAAGVSAIALSGRSLLDFDEQLRRRAHADRDPLIVFALQPHAVRHFIARFDFDRLPGLELVALDEPQERRDPDRSRA